jgi:hypothetical protein
MATKAKPTGLKKWLVEVTGTVTVMAKTEEGAMTKAKAMVRKNPDHLNAYAQPYGYERRSRK